MSASRGFVDANILVYAHDPSAGDKQRQAIALMDRLWQDDAGQLSVQVLQEFFVTVTRKVARPLTVDAAEALVADYVAWPVFSPSAHDVMAAIALCRSAKVSFWDAMILHAAAESGCDVCWTEDLAHGTVWRGVQIRNPFVEPPQATRGRRSGGRRGM